MTLLVALPQFGSDATKDLVVSILVREHPLKTKAIHQRLTDQGKRVSYQAVHKLLGELTSEGVLKKDGLAYSIDMDWLEKVETFVRQVRRNYGKAEGFSSASKLEIHGAVTLAEFYTLEDFDNFLFQYEESFHLSKGGPVFWKAPHYWWPLVYPKEMFDAQISKRRRYPSLKVFSEDTELDRWVSGFYMDLGVETWFEGEREDEPIEVEEGAYFAIYGDDILQLALPPALKRDLHEAFVETKSLETFSFASFYEMVLKHRYKIKVTIQTNPQFAKALLRQFQVAA